MLQVLPSDRASVPELCVDPWTVQTCGPMPPPSDAVLVECSAPELHASRACGGSLRYLGYAALLVGAFVLYRQRGGGTPIVLEESAM